jgi:DNA polymerase epsilon subunit 2
MKYKFLANHAKFIFVPGPNDAGVCNNILPRKSIPDMFTSELRKKIKNVVFGSNPCRLRFYTQEILIFREDLSKKFQRHSIFNIGSFSKKDCDDISKNENEKTAPDISTMVVNTLLNQAHLCPLPSYIKPIHWELDHTLRLSPLPDLVITFIVRFSTQEHF